MELGKYSMGIGDRFAKQGLAQLKALQIAADKGIEITPVWNKSFREHQIVFSFPHETREAADEAVIKANWAKAYFVDADHINFQTVDNFIDHCDFFTIDVADYIGKSDSTARIEGFINKNKTIQFNPKLHGIPGLEIISIPDLERFAHKYLLAIGEAARIYKKIETKKGANNFITEVSMDEVNEPQTPFELFFILKEMDLEGIPLDTIAPKFTGRFNKGIDYSGNIDEFEIEFEQFLKVISVARIDFKLKKQLKLSIHSGSDKFSLYPIMGKLIRKYNQGIHLKTAGTSWLEEVIGLAMASNETLEIAKKIYIKALSRFDELCLPYKTVLNINVKNLPTSNEVEKWDSRKFVNTLRHVPLNPEYSPDFRQLIHVAYKIAAEYGNVYFHHLNANKKVIGEQVTENLYSRHIQPLFLS